MCNKRQISLKETNKKVSTSDLEQFQVSHQRLRCKDPPVVGVKDQLLARLHGPVHMWDYVTSA